ncbi:MAG: peptidoglycan-binding protein [Gammaproteobacteria bacterium]|nr:peptidoglycan-binding protein [Gammaproteobacteria bacterium]
MTTSSTGEKDKLSISVCDVDNNGKITVNEGKTFKFMLNPSEYDHSFEIQYSQREAMGQSGSDVKFAGVKPEKLKFNTLIDVTGAISGPDLVTKDVKTQIKELKEIVYQYAGNDHEPNHIRVLWGSQIFYGRLDTMKVENTLFKPSGEPLRAKLQLSFLGFMSKEEEALRANRSSPDMTHLIEVKAGDTLPMLCYRVYKDCAYYPDIARINKLTDFRDIKPGSKLHFPPLR